MQVRWRGVEGREEGGVSVYADGKRGWTLSRPFLGVRDGEVVVVWLRGEERSTVRSYLSTCTCTFEQRVIGPLLLRRLLLLLLWTWSLTAVGRREGELPTYLPTVPIFRLCLEERRGGYAFFFLATGLGTILSCFKSWKERERIVPTYIGYCLSIRSQASVLLYQRRINRWNRLVRRYVGNVRACVRRGRCSVQF